MSQKSLFDKNHQLFSAGGGSLYFPVTFQVTSTKKEPQKRKETTLINLFRKLELINIVTKLNNAKYQM